MSEDIEDTAAKILDLRLDTVEKSIESINGCLTKLTDVVTELALQKKDISFLKENIEQNKKDIKELKDNSHKWGNRILDILLTALVSGMVGSFVVFLLKK